MAPGEMGQVVLYLVVLLLLVKPLGAYMARVYQGKRVLLDRLLGPLERLIYRACGVSADDEMDWKTYAVAMLVFGAASALVVYAMQRLQGFLPANPQHLGAVSVDSAFNTAVSYATNTNWQGYSGETTMSYLTQMVALTVQNFVSAATGMAVLVALIRGLTRESAKTMGCFWVDLTRGTLYVLLPLSVALTMVLVSQGVVQTMAPYATVTTLQGATQTIAVGPAAAQVAIKQLGTNGGGFFNANSAHPFENPTPLANFLELLAILLIPAALCFTYGEMIGERRQGWAILAAMTVLFVATLAPAEWAEHQANPVLAKLGVDMRAGNMEGKETRVGTGMSVLWETATTAASNGSVNSMHESYMPLGGLAALWLMQLGEVVYGGVGSGLYGMLAHVIIAVFVAGLMVGRTPEYLGKKIESFEMKMAALVVLATVLLVLIGTAVAVVTPVAKAAISDHGTHGFSEVLYAFSSAGNNNGSAFAGLNANTPFYNWLLGFVMLIGRYGPAVPVLAMAGALAKKRKVPPSAGTLPTHTPLFVAWVLAVVVIVGALSFLPALALGPIAEHMTMIH